MGLGINYVILANHLVSLITSSTTDPGLCPHDQFDSPVRYSDKNAESDNKDQ